MDAKMIRRRRPDEEQSGPESSDAGPADNGKRRQERGRKDALGGLAPPRRSGDKDVIRGNVFRSSRAVGEQKAAREAIMRGEGRTELEFVRSPRRRGSPTQGTSRGAATTPPPVREDKGKPGGDTRTDDPVERARRALMEL
jgi:hypothetical protein